STIALQYCHQMASRGQKSMYFTFDETLAVMLNRGTAMGIHLKDSFKAGLVKVSQIDPAEISPGEFVSRIVRGVEAGVELVVVDSLNGYLNAMPGEKYLANQLHELFTYLNQQGVVTIVILAQNGLFNDISQPIDITYLADTVITLRFFECLGEIKQA